MITWSTEDIPARYRFEHWLEEWSRRVFGVDVEIEPERRDQFSGRLGMRAIGPATLIEIAVAPYTTRRTRRAIERTPESSFCIWRMERGRGIFISESGEQRLGDDAIMTTPANTTFTRIPNQGGVMRSRLVKVPIASLGGPAIERDRLDLRHHRIESGIDVLLGSYFDVFLQEAPSLTGAAAEQAVQTLAHLALASGGRADCRDQPVDAAISEALLVRARRLVDRDLHRADLSPARIAKALGISLRKLHLVFEPSGTSVSRYVMERRLVRAHRLLVRSHGLPVTEVAYACGFDSLSTFFRCYRAVYGDTPGARRDFGRRRKQEG